MREGERDYDKGQSAVREMLALGKEEGYHHKGANTLRFQLACGSPR